MFVNLLTNALKFTFKGYIKIKVLIENHYECAVFDETAQEAQRQDTVTIKVSVEDSGLGIKDEDKGKLFKMFGKLKQDSVDINPHGIGLGLTICNSVLSQLGG